MNEYVTIKEIAQAKGLKSTRSIRMEINKPESKYISREVKVNGGISYEILFSSLEPELQQKLRECETKSTAIVPLNYKPPVITDKARQTANHRMNIVKAALEHRNKYSSIKEADAEFLDLYNSGLYLPKAYEFLGSISIGTLRRYIQAYKKTGNAESLIPQYKITKQGEYNSILDDNMKKVLLALLLHQNKFGYNTAIRLAKQVLIKNGYDEDALPSNITFKRFAEHFRKNNYAEWVLRREGMKAYHDKVEPYIERDISKIEVGDVLIADGHVLNFQVINPFTGKPTRATLVGFLDWKSTALVGYEIMMTENTQCIASALRNAIINLGIIPKVVYQDNGKAFKAKYFQSCDFDEECFNGVYANLDIHSVFAKPYNARAKVIERFFLDFQEEFEKLMPSYIGTSIENRPAWMNRGTMFFEVARILKDKRPRYFILENVKGLLNHDSGKTFQTILKILTDLGYQVQWQLLNSKFFGVPQNRERVYIVGCYGKGCAGKIFPLTPDGIENISTLNKHPLSPKTPQGNRIYLPDGLSSCLTANGGGLGAKTGLYFVNRVRYDKYRPSDTVQTLLVAGDTPLMRVRNGTKKGYDEAIPGDGINLAFPHSKTRRGRVGKGYSKRYSLCFG